MRIGLAFKVFFKALAGGKSADALQAALQEQGDGRRSLPSPDSVVDKKVDKPAPVVVQAPARSDALTLLSALQREARLIDLVQEPLDQYGDAQVGAAARDVLRDTKKVLDRICGIQPLLNESEGTKIDLPDSISPMRWRLSGSQGSASGPRRATVVHPGWKAAFCQLPKWTGTEDDALVLTPAEVEIVN